MCYASLIFVFDAPEQVFVGVLWVSPVGVIPPVFFVFVYSFLPDGQTNEAWEPSKSNTVSEIGKHWIEKYFNVFLS
jgi:hypothetical protein